MISGRNLSPRLLSRLLIAVGLLAVTLSSSARIYEYDVPEELTIAFSGNSYKKYLNLVSEAKSSEPRNIGDEFKKFLKVFGTYRDQSGNERLFSGKARITGDLKDHLAPSKRISSLSFSLKDGNVGGVVKFRLLLPETRLAENEVFWSLLMEELGFPVPYRRLVNVNLMGSQHLFIFEEKPEKEFLESNGFREGPIIEYDERQVWANLSRGSWSKSLDQLKIKNSDFLKNKTSFEIAYRSLYPDFDRNDFFQSYDQVNKRFAGHGITSHNRKYLYDVIYNDYLPIYFDGDVFSGMSDLCHEVGMDEVTPNAVSAYNTRIKILERKFKDRVFNQVFSQGYRCVASKVFEFFDDQNIRFTDIRPLTPIRLNIEEKGLNSMILRDRAVRHRPAKYEYDAKTGQMTECFNIDPSGRDYLARYSDLTAAYRESASTKAEEQWGEHHFREFGTVEKRVFFAPAITEEMFRHYVDRYEGLLSVYEENFSGVSKALWGEQHFYSYGLSEGRIVYDPDDDDDKEQVINEMLRKNYSGSYWGNCRELSSKKLRKVFSGEDNFLKLSGFPFYSFLNINYIPTLRETFRDLEVVDAEKEIYVEEGVLYLNLSADNSTITFILANERSYVVLHNSVLNNSQINIKIENSNNSAVEIQESRFNTKLLTACFTLIDSKVQNLGLRIKSCSKEDAINFIRTSGEFVNLEILDSKFDGLDSDFSTIHFSAVRVERAGNDCVDLSAGIYNLNNVQLNDCGDKAVSAGERSSVSLNNLSIRQSDTAVASKDQSHVFLSGDVSIVDFKDCLLAFQKKQEFGGAFIYSETPIPSCNFRTKNKGSYGIGNACHFVSRSYFFDLCVSNEHLTITLNGELPDDQLVFVDSRSRESEGWAEISEISFGDGFSGCPQAIHCHYKIPIKEVGTLYRVGLRDRMSGEENFIRITN